MFDEMPLKNTPHPRALIGPSFCFALGDFPFSVDIVDIFLVHVTRKTNFGVLNELIIKSKNSHIYENPSNISLTRM